jgi:hypothetical protein
VIPWPQPLVVFFEPVFSPLDGVLRAKLLVDEELVDVAWWPNGAVRRRTPEGPW